MRYHNAALKFTPSINKCSEAFFTFLFAVHQCMRGMAGCCHLGELCLHFLFEMYPEASLEIHQVKEFQEVAFGLCKTNSFGSESINLATLSIESSQEPNLFQVFHCTYPQVIQQMEQIHQMSPCRWQCTRSRSLGPMTNKLLAERQRVRSMYSWWSKWLGCSPRL